MPLMLLSVLGGVKSCFTAVFGFLAKLNPWQLACLALALFAVVEHFELISARHSAAKWQRQYQTVQTENAKLSARIAAADKTIANQTAQIRKANDETNRLIAGDAGDLRLHGPGRSICRPSASGSSSGSQPPGAKPNASGPPLPPADGEDLSAVPWDWLVTRGEEHDQLRAEVQSWRDWYQVLIANWPKPRASHDSAAGANH